MSHRELLGTTSTGDKVHLADDSTRPDERYTSCTANNLNPTSITTVVGSVYDSGHEGLCASLHGAEIAPDLLCQICFGTGIIEPYRAQWTARHEPSTSDPDAVEITVDGRASVTTITLNDDGNAEGFAVRVAGTDPDLFRTMANNAALNVAQRLGWDGARLTRIHTLDEHPVTVFVYTRHDSVGNLIDWPPVRTRPAAPRPKRLEYDPGSPERRGPIYLSSEGTVTITFGGEPLVGIDVHAGTVIVWPDGEHAQTVARFDPDATPGEATAAVSPPFEWTTATGRYRGVAFAGPGYDYTAVFRADQHRRWQPFARVDSDPTNPIVAFDEWRMRRTGYVMTGEPYPAWTAAHGDARDTSGLPEQLPQQPINPTVTAAMRAVLAYTWADEQADYQRQDDDGRARHVFRELTTIRRWLDPTSPVDGDDLSDA